MFFIRDDILFVLTNLDVNPMSELSMKCLLHGCIYCIEYSQCICANNTPPDFKYVLQMANGASSAKRVHLSWRCNSMKPIIAVKRQRVCGLWLA